MSNSKHVEGKRCSEILPSVADALYVISGKWKLPILIAVRFNNKRFSQIAREIPNITDRMLSKELRELEANELISRTVYDTVPATVEYALTEYGRSLDGVIHSLSEWGKKHRRRLMKKETA